MTDHVIEVDRLRRTFGSFVAVDDVSFNVNKGEIFGYLGANGAGKSTTIRMLCGLLNPSGGRAMVAGCQLGSDSTLLRSRIGYMSQKFSLYLDLPVEANIEFFGGAYGLYGKALRKRRDEILERIGLQEYRNTTTADLPGGTRQRLALGTALLHAPDIVFLDEPTAGVDPASRRVFWTLIRQLAREGTTVFVTTHYMDEAEYCARIGLMVQGRLVALDSPRALKTQWVPGEVISIHNRDVAQVRGALAAAAGVLAIEAFGSTVRIRFDPERLTRADVDLALRARGSQDPVIEAADASLEDVFLAAVSSDVPVKHAGLGHTAAAHPVIERKDAP
jgi:ABC-2 type transport system ATP-binding protein